MFQAIWKFINYWYFRYLLVTELYMVEKWERLTIHIVFAVIITILSYFNSAIFLTLIQYLTKPLFEGYNVGHISAGHPFLDGSSQNIMT